MDELVERISRKYRTQLYDLQRKLFTDTAVDVLIDMAVRPPAAMGPCNSVTDRFAAVSVVADITSLATLQPAAGLEGSLLTISVRGQNRTLGNQVRLADEESDAWAAAVAGPQWAPHLYSQGARGGTGPIATRYYRLFLTADHSPTTPTGHLSDLVQPL